MKYFTKDYFTSDLLSFSIKHVKPSKKAEIKNEAFYQSVYEKQYAIFQNNEKHCFWYLDPTKELKNIAIDTRISEEEKKLLTQVYENFPKDKIVYTFDENLCRQKFAERQRNNVALYSQLPQYITDKIADIRVFALGYASAEVIQLLRPYCSELKKSLKKIVDKDTAKAKKFLKNKISFDGFENFIIIAIEEKNGDLHIEGVDGYRITIKDAKIIEGQEKKVFRYDGKKPNSPISLVLAAEIHRVENLFEAHFLIQNISKTEQTELWNLTVRGTDIKETC